MLFLPMAVFAMPAGVYPKTKNGDTFLAPGNPSARANFLSPNHQDCDKLVVVFARAGDLGVLCGGGLTWGRFAVGPKTVVLL